jgi:hypothetical protein
MKNPSGKKIDKLVFGMFDQMVEGADKYVTEQGSTWLIFTDEKRWIIEFTEDRTLWFNYNLFQSEFELIGKDCIEDIDLIKNWFESRFLNKPKVKETDWCLHLTLESVEDTIQNGVKGTDFSLIDPIDSVEDTIQNGVKDTRLSSQSLSYQVGDIIQNGVKDIDTLKGLPMEHVEYTIQNGVKYTGNGSGILCFLVEDTIKNGEKIK